MVFFITMEILSILFFIMVNLSPYILIQIYHMLELNIDNRKTQITNANNQQNILGLTKLMSQQTDSQTLSTLFTNRGVLYFQLGNYEWALSDFQKAFQFNHLNFVTYFNVFSLCVCQNNLMEGLKNLCCALSCMYLMRSRIEGNESDVNKCVKLAENNHEGRLMKALQYKRKGKYSLALNQIKWILQAEQYNPQILQIRNHLLQLIKKQSKGKTVSRYNQMSSSSEIEQYQNKDRNRRLVCTLYDDISLNQSLNSEKQIQIRLREFNQLYEQLFKNSTTRHQGALFNIYLLDRYQQHNIASRQQELGSEIKPKQRPSFFSPEYQVQNSYCITNSPQRSQNRQVYNQNDSLLHVVGAPRTSIFDQAGSTDSYCLQSSQSASYNQFGQINSQKIKKTSSKQKQHSKQQTINNSYDGNSFITIRALDDQKQLNMRVEKIQLYNLPEEEVQKMSNIYCTFQYGQNKIRLAKSTPLQNQIQTHKSTIETKKLTVRVLNKEILAFKDTFIGEGEQQITKQGKYRIPVYFTKSSSQQIGVVIIDIKFKNQL